MTTRRLLLVFFLLSRMTGTTAAARRSPLLRRRVLQEEEKAIDYFQLQQKFGMFTAPPQMEGESVITASQEEGESVITASQEEGENVITASQESEENIFTASQEEGESVITASQEEGESVITASQEEGESVITAPQDEEKNHSKPYGEKYVFHFNKEESNNGNNNNQEQQELIKSIAEEAPPQEEGESVITAPQEEGESVITASQDEEKNHSKPHEEKYVFQFNEEGSNNGKNDNQEQPELIKSIAEEEGLAQMNNDEVNSSQKQQQEPQEQPKTQEQETQELEMQELETQKQETQELKTQEQETQELETQKQETQEQQQEPQEKKQETSSSPSLRFAAFGSSRTWGAAIDDREHKAYISLLNGTNYGIRGSGPEYPAMCTYSMIGDDQIYDVVIIEFMLDWVTEALHELGERLRHRFPESTIIFLNYWAPRQYLYKPTDQNFHDFHKERSKNNGAGISDSADQFQPEVLDGTDSQDWSYEPYDRAVILEAAERANGYVLDLPQLKDPIHTLKTFGDLYTPDMTHFSEKGHLFIHDEILSLLAQLGKLHIDPKETKVNEWDSTDYCTLWYETGKMDLPTTIEMVEFKPSKFALEARNDTFNNKIELTNPWKTQGYLYVSYMATGPDEMYPKAVARVIHSPDHKETAGFLLNTHVPGVTHGSLHIVMHWKVGAVLPGKSDLTIHVSNATPHPWPMLRIVGLILSPRQYDGSGRVSANF